MAMRRFDLELSVGLFFIVGIACLGYLSIRLGKMEVLGTRGSTIYAEFSNVGGLKNGSVVEIAGVEVGRVKNITLDEYQAKVQLQIESKVKIPEDAIASIKTKGLIGEKYIEITPGGSDSIIKSGGKIRDTQPPFDLEQAVSKLVFGIVSE
jgi:phospholipid/cholesterol/gamma-HCH transport system substrate-binding protein